MHSGVKERFKYWKVWYDSHCKLILKNIWMNNNRKVNRHGISGCSDVGKEISGREGTRLIGVAACVINW